MYELALFAGAGGGLLATKHLLGWRTACYVEINEYRVEVLKARIRDGLLDDAPIWDDARTFDGRPWRGCVDIVTAGFPCQPFSGAGNQEADGDDRNLWPDTIRIVREIEPRFVFLENVTGLLSSSHGYFGQILRDLAEGGYYARWRVLSAVEMGAAHKRDRLFIVAYSNSERFSIPAARTDTKTRCVAAKSQQSDGNGLRPQVDRCFFLSKQWGDYAAGIPRNADGVAHRVDRLAAVGDGQVPSVVAAVWELLT